MAQTVRLGLLLSSLKLSTRLLWRRRVTYTHTITINYTLYTIYYTVTNITTATNLHHTILPVMLLLLLLQLPVLSFAVAHEQSLLLLPVTVIVLVYCCLNHCYHDASVIGVLILYCRYRSVLRISLLSLLAVLSVVVVLLLLLLLATLIRDSVM
jgi:hypothetical protein